MCFKVVPSTSSRLKLEDSNPIFRSESFIRVSLWKHKNLQRNIRECFFHTDKNRGWNWVRSMDCTYSEVQVGGLGCKCCWQTLPPASFNVWTPLLTGHPYPQHNYTGDEKTPCWNISRCSFSLRVSTAAMTIPRPCPSQITVQVLLANPPSCFFQCLDPTSQSLPPTQLRRFISNHIIITTTVKLNTTKEAVSKIHSEQQGSMKGMSSKES